jgi:hypothetical protein
MTTTPTDATTERRERRSDRPKIPYREQVRGFRMHDDDRELILDRRHIAFATPYREEPEISTVLGLKGSKPVVVRTAYAEIVKWWLGKDAPPVPPAKVNGKAA